MFNTLASQIALVFVVGICGFALLKGDSTERTAASAYLLSWIASLVSQTQFPSDTHKWMIFGIDCLMLALYVILVWRSRANWLVWVVGLQLLAVASHLVIVARPEASANAVYTVLSLTAYGILIALGIGTFWAWQERKAAGLE